MVDVVRAVPLVPVASATWSYVALSRPRACWSAVAPENAAVVVDHAAEYQATGPIAWSLFQKGSIAREIPRRSTVTGGFAGGPAMDDSHLLDGGADTVDFLMAHWSTW